MHLEFRKLSDHGPPTQRKHLKDKRMLTSRVKYLWKKLVKRRDDDLKAAKEM